MKATDLPFHDLAGKLKPKHFRGTLVCFDPGETTGLAIFRNGQLDETSQLTTKTVDEGTEAVEQLFCSLKFHPNRYNVMTAFRPHNVRVVMEDYKVYGWKTDQHAWAALHTPKFIGAIIALCTIHGIPYHLQMAQQAKQFCTDDKLKGWGYYDKGMRHARDAVRHGCYYTLFNEEDHDTSETVPLK